MMRRLERPVGATAPGAPAAPVGHGWRTHLAVALMAIALVAPIALLMYRNLLDGAREQVTQIASFEATWLETWFEERMASAGLSATSFPQAELYLAWQRDHDLVARDRLFRRLGEFADAGGFSGVSLLAPSGRLLWAEGVHAAALGAVHPGWEADGVVSDGARVRSYRDGLGATRVDFVVTLPVDDPDARPGVVYHSSPADLLPPQPADWTMGTRTGRVLVARSFGDEVSVVGPERGGGDLVISETIMPDGRTDEVAVRLALGAKGDAVRVVEGPDHAGVRVIAAGREAGDTGWFVVARIDRREVLAAVVPTTVAAALAAVLLYVIGLLLLEHARRQQRAAVVRGVETAETERERATRLLSAVADASPDAIYAKDLDGRYTLINRAGAEIVSRRVDEVLGRTDWEIFGEASAAMLGANERGIIEDPRVATFEEHVETAAGPLVFLATKGPLVDGSGRATGTFGISRDITERRAAEQAVVDQAATLTAALDDLERFNRVLVDRELVMVALKQRVNAYAVRLGEAPPFTGDAIVASENDDG